ncbi:hypothetical protein [Hymenobacter rubripertinctus]|uniref:Uncharacterized protein n=1 Tax=Hymenobacter rubripertinctus TaxID=2029981 RepID=A0A418QV63_9BACT|nr:hypothetical protein [Hymenobacter rubripertinctus]RIY09097.1 hypothetical protein D0T11_13060 [Hymenobacter rubripertinctus]
MMLTVHSWLEAVGLTAGFARALAQGGISYNVVAACYHDPIFVAATGADEFLRLLRELAAAQQGRFFFRS